MTVPGALILVFPSVLLLWYLNKSQCKSYRIIIDLECSKATHLGVASASFTCSFSHIVLWISSWGIFLIGAVSFLTTSYNLIGWGRKANFSQDTITNAPVKCFLLISNVLLTEPGVSQRHECTLLGKAFALSSAGLRQDFWSFLSYKRTLEILRFSVNSCVFCTYLELFAGNFCVAEEQILAWLC